MRIFKNIFKQFSRVELTLLIILLVSTTSLRFINLGYSDYIQDETGTFFYKGGSKNTHMTKTEYILNEAKGPLQIFVSYIPYLIVGDYSNELAQRIPFSLFSTASVFTLYFMIKKISKNMAIAFFAAYMFSVNGLIVGYGRIAQYQNLLFFFSFLSIYFYASLEEKNSNYLKTSLIGTVLFSIAFYAHWYSVFALIPISFFYLRFLKNKEVINKFKIKLTLLNIFVFLLVTTPFFLPYALNISNNEKNTTYASNTLGEGLKWEDRYDYPQFLLYNPFVTSYVYTVFFIIGTIKSLKSRKNLLYVIWTILVMVIFRYFVAYTGLHFYNILIPLILVCAVGISWVFNIKYKFIKYFLGLGVTVIMCFLWFQSYMLFVDHTKEYPVEEKSILMFKTKEITQEDRLRHKTGFPHKRYWAEINKFIEEENKKNNENLGYFSNEDKGISRIYMSSEISTSRPFYAIGIKRPQSLANDYKFPQFNKKSTIHTIENEKGNTVVRIYRVKEK